MMVLYVLRWVVFIAGAIVAVALLAPIAIFVLAILVLFLLG